MSVVYCTNCIKSTLVSLSGCSGLLAAGCLYGCSGLQAAGCLDGCSGLQAAGWLDGCSGLQAAGWLGWLDSCTGDLYGCCISLQKTTKRNVTRAMFWFYTRAIRNTLFYMLPHDSWGKSQNWYVRVTRPSRFFAEGLRLPDYT